MGDGGDDIDGSGIEYRATDQGSVIGFGGGVNLY
jgi:hypothetical protein